MNRHVLPDELLDRVQSLSTAVDELPDAHARELAQELVAAVIAMYGDGLRRIMEAISASREAGAAIVDQLTQDGALASLLLIHDLYPISLEQRVIEALDTVRPYMDSHGGNVELLGVQDGVARFELQGSCDGCAASQATLELAIKQALDDHCPDLMGLDVRGVPGARRAGTLAARARRRAGGGSQLRVRAAGGAGGGRRVSERLVALAGRGSRAHEERKSDRDPEHPPQLLAALKPVEPQGAHPGRPVLRIVRVKRPARFARAQIRRSSRCRRCRCSSGITVPQMSQRSCGRAPGPPPSETANRPPSETANRPPAPRRAPAPDCASGRINANVCARRRAATIASKRSLTCGSDPAHPVVAFYPPIDVCYALVGLVKSRWEGISGGAALGAAVREFLETVRARAVSVQARRDAQVGAFSGSTTFALELPCTYDLEVAATKYFYALADGFVPLSFHWGGTVFYYGADGRLQVVPVPWSASAQFRMPLEAWRTMIAEHYPGGGWIRIGADTLARLNARRADRGLPSFDACPEELLDDR